MHSDTLTIPDTCEVLNTSRATVYDEINAGRLRSFTIGRRRYVSREAIADYIREREGEADLPKHRPCPRRKGDGVGATA